MNFIKLPQTKEKNDETTQITNMKVRYGISTDSHILLS